MRIHEKIAWWITGEVAERVVEMENWVEAALSPILFFIIASSLWGAAFTVVGLNWATSSYIGLAAFLAYSMLAVLMTIIFSISVFAMVTYMKEETEMPANEVMGP
jgi:hypothetical protein